MRALAPIALVVLPYLAAGCGGCDPTEPCAVDGEDFQQLPALDELDFNQVEPAEAYTYWEFRQDFGHRDFEVIATGGSEERMDLPPEVVAALDALPFVGSGFHNYCLPGLCGHYFTSVRDSEVRAWSFRDEVVEFLGPVDNAVEAALVVGAHGYYWRTPDTGIRIVGDGYEALAFKMVRFCDPIRVDRYRLTVTREGLVTVVGSEVYSEKGGVCI